MDHSFSYIENILKSQQCSQSDFPYQDILLIRLCMHTLTKLSEFRNKLFREHNLNETLFMALVILKSQPNQSIQPSELSKALGSSKTNATRIANELEKQGWIDRQVNHHDRRSQQLTLTDSGRDFLAKLLPTQHKQLHHLWSILSHNEQQQLETLMNKLLSHLEQLNPPTSVAN